MANIGVSYHVNPKEHVQHTLTVLFQVA